MGDGAEKLMAVFSEKNIEIAEFFASDEFVRGHSFHGKRVKKFSEIIEQYGQVMIVVAFASQLPDVMNRVWELSELHPLVIPDLPVAGTDLFTLEYAKQHREELLSAYELMSDEQSRLVFRNTLNYKISGKATYLREMETNKDEVFYNLIKPTSNEHFADLGAYRGDTIAELLHYTDGSYGSITAMEPDAKTFTKLTTACEGMTNVNLYNMAAWSHQETLYFDKRAGRNSKLSTTGKVPVTAQALDNLAQDKQISYLKMDIEGAEKEGLQGAASTIKKWQPKLNIAGYHRSEDLFAIPLQIHALCPNYKIYLRHHPYFPAWDNNFYAI